MSSIRDIRNKVEQLKGRREEAQRNLKDAETRHAIAKKDLANNEQAREILREVGLKTQQALAFHVSDITTLALESVFDDPYELILEFVQRRNKTEADLYFMRDLDKVNPIDASGGGAVDVAAFALRVASWSMLRPKTRPVIILDEPMRFLSSDLQPKASEVLKELSQKLGLQFLIVTHEDEIASTADKIFKVNKRKKVSKIS